MAAANKEWKGIDLRRSGRNPGKRNTRVGYGKRRSLERRQKAGQQQCACPDLNQWKRHFRPADRRTISCSLGNRKGAGGETQDQQQRPLLSELI